MNLRKYRRSLTADEGEHKRPHFKFQEEQEKPVFRLKEEHERLDYRFEEENKKRDVTPDQGLNPGLCEYEAGVLVNELPHLVPLVRNCRVQNSL